MQVMKLKDASGYSEAPVSCDLVLDEVVEHRRLPASCPTWKKSAMRALSHSAQTSLERYT
jgi:hypothetical protein